MQPSTTTLSDVARPCLLTMTVSLFENWSGATVLTPRIDCVYDISGGKWAYSGPFLRLARQMLRIGSEHDLLWSRLIKPQGNGGSDVTSLTCQSK
jgi:hypothetical protein